MLFSESKSEGDPSSRLVVDYIERGYGKTEGQYDIPSSSDIVTAHKQMEVLYRRMSLGQGDTRVDSTDAALLKYNMRAEEYLRAQRRPPQWEDLRTVSEDQFPGYLASPECRGYVDSARYILSNGEFGTGTLLSQLGMVDMVRFAILSGQYAAAMTLAKVEGDVFDIAVDLFKKMDALDAKLRAEFPHAERIGVNELMCRYHRLLAEVMGREVDEDLFTSDEVVELLAIGFRLGTMDERGLEESIILPE